MRLDPLYRVTFTTPESWRVELEGDTGSEGRSFLIAEGRTQYGMQTFDQSLMDLYRRGLISEEMALQYATSPSEFALRASGVEASSDLTFEPGSGRREI